MQDCGMHRPGIIKDDYRSTKYRMFPAWRWILKRFTGKAQTGTARSGSRAVPV